MAVLSDVAVGVVRQAHAFPLRELIVDIVRGRRSRRRVGASIAPTESRVPAGQGVGIHLRDPGAAHRILENGVANLSCLHYQHSSKPAPFDEPTPKGCATQNLPSLLVSAPPAA